ncbi:MAG: BrnT family toxin [Candidatus Solibacter usitatus]|nr:BrnT family toxin [Candidatus Solibacter usitatus]
MIFDWDAANVEHIARHGVTPEECEEAYRNGPMVIERQTRKRERRRLCLGETRTGRLLTLVITERVGKIRFVTAYPMHPKQREIYRGEEE